MQDKGAGWWVLAAVLVALSPSGVAGDTAPGVSQERKAQAADAVARSARHAGEVADETADCNGLSYLLKALPAADVLLGMEAIYRGCESPVTANLQYAAGDGELTYTLGILDAGLAELPHGNDYWQSILDVNRESMQSLMKAQGKLASSGQGRSEAVVLADGARAVIFREGNDWSLLALPQERYALRIDLVGFDKAQAPQLLLNAAAALNLDALRQQ